MQISSLQITPDSHVGHPKQDRDNMSAKSLWRALKRHSLPANPSPMKSVFDITALKPQTRQHNEAVIRGLCHNAYLGDNSSLCRVLGRYGMFVDTTDLGFSSHMLMSGYWEMWVTEAMVARVRPGMHVVDCGANLGYFTLIMADLVGPGGRVDAFEPNPAIAAKLAKSMELNGFLDRTTVHEAALAQASGEALLHVPPREPKNAYLSPVAARAADSSVAIKTLRLDEIESAETIDLIKIDVEGAEENVWTGMQRILDAKRALTVILEFASARYADPKGFIDRILSHGFSLELIDYVAGVVPTTCEEILSRPAGIDQMLVFVRS